jgi:hypothetical protein
MDFQINIMDLANQANPRSNQQLLVYFQQKTGATAPACFEAA